VSVANDLVRITSDEDGSAFECELDDFLAQNETCFGWGEEERFAAGERIAIGGGAAPLVYVELVKVPS
jgi:hypothetical protein